MIHMFLASLSIIHQGLIPLNTGQASHYQPWVLNCIRNHSSPNGFIHFVSLRADSALLGIALWQQALQGDLFPRERRGLTASPAGRVQKSSLPTSQGYYKITQEHATPPPWGTAACIGQGSPAVCGKGLASPVMCGHHRPPLCALWAEPVMNIYCSHNSGFHVCHCCSSVESQSANHCKSGLHYSRQLLSCLV